MYVKNLRGEGGQPLSSIAVHWRASIPMLQVQGVHKCYVTAQGPLTVLAGVDLH
ncbi:ABC transporter ATP-binding protein, partial [Pseudomonas sp. KHB2.9]